MYCAKGSHNPSNYPSTGTSLCRVHGKRLRFRSQSSHPSGRPPSSGTEQDAKCTQAYPGYFCRERRVSPLGTGNGTPWSLGRHLTQPERGWEWFCKDDDCSAGSARGELAREEGDRHCCLLE